MYLHPNKGIIMKYKYYFLASQLVFNFYVDATIIVPFSKVPGGLVRVTGPKVKSDGIICY